MSVRGWLMPIKKIKLTMYTPQYVGRFMPVSPRPKMNWRAYMNPPQALTADSASAASQKRAPGAANTGSINLALSRGSTLSMLAFSQINYLRMRANFLKQPKGARAFG